MAICYGLERPLTRQQQQPTPEGLRVAEVFKTLRRDASMTQEDVAREVDLTLSGYRPYEQGRRQLRIEQLPTFARAFRVSVDHLAAHLGLNATDQRQMRMAECADILTQLDGEPPEIIDGVMQMLRTSVAIAKNRRLVREN